MADTPSSITYLYFANLNRLKVEKDRLFTLLNGEESERSKGIRNQNRLKQFLVARWLIKNILASNFQIPLSHDYKISNFSNWVCTQSDDIFTISITHSRNIVAVALSKDATRFGIDVEYHKRRDFLPLADSFAHANEKQLLANKTIVNQAFYKLWTAKEALYKARPMSFEQAKQIDLSALLSNNELILQEMMFHYWPCEQGKYSLTLCIPPDCLIQMCEISGEFTKLD